jgi:DNA invertase Pin-like site-specific DNA recombinase
MAVWGYVRVSTERQTEFGFWPRIVRHPRRWREKTLH